jgi:hypothetical protein
MAAHAREFEQVTEPCGIRKGLGMGNFEEKYFDVLQNIEFGIVRVYRQRSDLVDFDVEQALSGLIREYKANQIGKPFDPPKFAPLVREVCKLPRRKRRGFGRRVARDPR